MHTLFVLLFSELATIKTLFVIILFSVSANSAVIIGDQSKVSITNGNGWVQSQGITKQIQSGEIIYTHENTAPSDAKRVSKGEMNNVYKSLKPATDENIINIQYYPVKNSVAKEIKKYLERLSINPNKILFTKINNEETEIFLMNIDMKIIEFIYPLYFKVATEFYSQSKNEDKIPTMKMQLHHMYIYHKKAFQNSGIDVRKLKQIE